MTAKPPAPVVAPWPLLEEQELGRYSIFTLTRSVRTSPTNGRKHRFLRFDPADWVNVIALTDDGALVLVEQYRHGTDSVTLEIPGGAVDCGEAPATAAARELEEETGYRAARIEPIGAVEPNPAIQSNTCWTFLALGCVASGVVCPDPSEEIRVHLATLADFSELIDHGEITHSLVVAAHDHLQRGIRHRRPWAEELRAWL